MRRAIFIVIVVSIFKTFQFISFDKVINEVFSIISCFQALKNTFDKVLVSSNISTFCTCRGIGEQGHCRVLGMLSVQATCQR